MTRPASRAPGATTTWPSTRITLCGYRPRPSSCFLLSMLDLVKQALIIGAILGAVKFLLGRFGGPLAQYAGYLG